MAWSTQTKSSDAWTPTTKSTGSWSGSQQAGDYKLLLEDGSYLLCEDNSRLILDQSGSSGWITQAKP
jgi:hypothetical protein